MPRSRPAAIANKAPVGWLRRAGVRPRRGRGLKGRCRTLAQREEIALGRARGDSIRTIGAIIGRSPSTVSRELRRNADGLGRYRATLYGTLSALVSIVLGRVRAPVQIIVEDDHDALGQRRGPNDRFC